MRHRLSVLYGDSDDEEKDVATRLAKAIAKEKEDKKHAEKAMPLYVWVPAFQVPFLAASVFHCRCMIAFCCRRT